MRQALARHIQETESLLAAPPPGTDWGAALARHLRWTAWLQHERLVHLLVTLAFGLLFFATTLAIALSPAGGGLATWWGAALDLLLLALLAPYLRHYWALENGVQRLYRLADRLERQNRNAERRTQSAE